MCDGGALHAGLVLQCIMSDRGAQNAGLGLPMCHRGTQNARLALLMSDRGALNQHLELRYVTGVHKMEV